jgi:predicted nucleotidyltransferase
MPPYNKAEMVTLIDEHREQVSDLCRKYSVERLDLFGSAVRADFDPDSSDLDFVVSFENFTIENAADRYFDFLSDLGALFGKRVDLVTDASIRNPYFRKSVDQERVTVYAV